MEELLDMKQLSLFDLMSDNENINQCTIMLILEARCYINVQEN